MFKKNAAVFSSGLLNDVNSFGFCFRVPLKNKIGFGVILSQKFTISQGNKTIILSGTTDAWNRTLAEWIIANHPEWDDEIIEKWSQTDDKETNVHNSIYRNLPFTHKEVKQILKNFNRIPKPQLQQFKAQFKDIPPGIISSDKTLQRFFEKLNSS